MYRQPRSRCAPGPRPLREYVIGQARYEAHVTTLKHISQPGDIIRAARVRGGSRTDHFGPAPVQHLPAPARHRPRRHCSTSTAPGSRSSSAPSARSCWTRRRRAHHHARSRARRSSAAPRRGRAARGRAGRTRASRPRRASCSSTCTTAARVRPARDARRSARGPSKFNHVQHLVDQSAECCGRIARFDAFRGSSPRARRAARQVRAMELIGKSSKARSDICTGAVGTTFASARRLRPPTTAEPRA